MEWHDAMKGDTPAPAPATIRCAECDCEKGGADCNWIATPNALDDPRVKALVEAAREVKADCIARADKHGVVPIGRGAWDQLTTALSALGENK